MPGAGGCFVPDADVDEALETEVLTHTQQMLSKFSSLLEVVTASLNDDGVVDAAEAARIRDAWQQLKRYGESFVRACEQGRFDG